MPQFHKHVQKHDQSKQDNKKSKIKKINM